MKISRPLFIVLKRLRFPLLLLLVVYAILILGYVLIPGQDEYGNPTQMSFFHAFYFVSFMGATIGFGELPNTFTEAQRFWTVFGIYVSVISWIYSINRLLTVLKDNAFQNVLTEAVFARKIKNIKRPFYLICGYGETGRQLTHMLSDEHIQTVVIDIEEKQINNLSIDEQYIDVPGLCADARDPEVLQLAGIQNKNCVAVLALSNDNQANIKIAISAKLLQPEICVIARSDNHRASANLLSFGTEYIINPYQIFARRLALAVRSPDAYLIYNWFTNSSHYLSSSLKNIPKGHWILCGYGRFGMEVAKYLEYEGVKCTVIDTNAKLLDATEDLLIGEGTEAITLKNAGINKADAIVAGTDNDANNLSIIMTARELTQQRDFFMTARQNHVRNQRIYQKANIDLVMQPSEIVAKEIMTIIKTPLLAQFLGHVYRKNSRWIQRFMAEINFLFQQDIEHIWSISLASDAFSDFNFWNAHNVLKLSELMKDIRDSEKMMRCLPLMIVRQQECRENICRKRYMLLPDLKTPLLSDDEILFCGEKEGHEMMLTLLSHSMYLDYIVNGEDYQQGWFARYFSKTSA